MLALVATGTEYTLLHGNPEKFLGPEVSIDGYEGQSVRVKAVRLSLGIGYLSPPPYPVNTLSVFPPLPSISWLFTYFRVCAYT